MTVSSPKLLRAYADLAIISANIGGRALREAVLQASKAGEDSENAITKLITGKQARQYVDENFYTDIHKNNDLYQKNNWLVPEISRMGLNEISSILEVGCGNGHFIRAASEIVKNVHGVDFALSPLLAGMPSNVAISRLDLIHDAVPSAELICSADVLEHIPPNNIRKVIRKLHAAGPRQYHLIACYDDGMSHQTVIPPAHWLALFLEQGADYRIHHIDARRGTPWQAVVYISNFKVPSVELLI